MYMKLVITLYMIFDKVFYKWKQKFMSLYNVMHPWNSEEYYTNDNSVIYLMKSPLYCGYCDLHHGISSAEIIRVFNTAKCDKRPSSQNI